MNWKDLKSWSSKAISQLTPPKHYLHRELGELEKKKGVSANFHDTLSRMLLTHLPENAEGLQFVLEGLASQGKTTELRRLAYSLQKLISDPTSTNISSRLVVHLFSMQNYSGIGANISTVEGLWDLLLSCNASRQVAREKITLDQFSDLHKSVGYRPILLIDTLDMLAYVRSNKEIEEATRLWADLTKKMTKMGMTVLWSVRPNEVGNKELDLELGIQRIQLPSVKWAEAQKTTKKFIAEFAGIEDNLDFVNFSTALLRQYPILSRYMGRLGPAISQLREQLYTILFEMYQGFRDKEPYQQFHPLDWVMKKENARGYPHLFQDESLRSNFILDEIYKFSRLAILKELEHNLPSVDMEYLEELWRDTIENVIFDQINDRRSQFSNRLWLDLKIETGNEDVDDNYEYLIRVGDDGHSGYGLFSISGEQVCFQHQLFSEYAAYRAACSRSKSKEQFEASIIRNIPSCRLRMGLFSIEEDDEQVDAFMKWFYPFFAINEKLQRITDDAPMTNLSVQWKEAKALAQGYLERKLEQGKTSGLLDQLSVDESKKASEDKVEILTNHSKHNRPLIINGPAGTGKSYIANPFITNFVSKKIREGALQPLQHHETDEDSGPSLQNLPIVKFLTLSKDLAINFQDEYREYFGSHMQKIPINLRSVSVDEYLHTLTNICVSSISFEEYQRLLLTESKFVYKLKRDKEFQGKSVSSVSPHTLWHEFLETVLDESGNLRGDDDFKRLSSLKNPKERDDFRAALARLGFLNLNKFMTRRKFASDISSELEKVFLQKGDPNSAINLLDRIDSLRSDVLIIDEVQDLGSAVLRLALLLHRGHQRDVAVLGDREQTLELKQFDWDSVFEQLGSKLYMLGEEQSMSLQDDHLGIKKWNHALGGVDLSNAGKDYRNEFLMVHRNIPPIVDMMKWSFRDSVSHEKLDVYLEPKDDELEGGTAHIIPSPVRENQYNKWRDKYRETGEIIQGGQLPKGVFFICDSSGKPTKITLKQLEDLLKTVAFSEEPVEVILPDPEHRLLVADRLQNEGIQQTIWDPVSIKGLENNVIIAVSPWSLHEDKLKNISSHTAWDKVVEDGIRNLEAFIEIIEQRRRHANVMLSRPRETLFILTLDAESHEALKLVDTTVPNLKAIFESGDGVEDEKYGKALDAVISNEITTIAMLKDVLSGGENEEDFRDPKRHMQLLEKLIVQSRGFEQIGVKAQQIYNIATPKLEADPRKYIFMFEKFRAIHDLFVGDPEVSPLKPDTYKHPLFIGNNGGVSTLGKFLFFKSYRSHNQGQYSKKNKNSSDLLDHERKAAFEKWQLKFFTISQRFNYSSERRPKLQYPPSSHDLLIHHFNEFVQDFASFEGEDDYTGFGEISSFVEQVLLGGTFDKADVNEWVERAKKIKLGEELMVHDLDSGVQRGRLAELLNLMAMFKPDYINDVLEKSSNRKDEESQLLIARGYSVESSGSDRTNKLSPYNTEDPREDLIDAQGLFESDFEEFWKDGIKWIELNELSSDQIQDLDSIYSDNLSQSGAKAPREGWARVQILWLFKLRLAAKEMPEKIDEAFFKDLLRKLGPIYKYSTDVDFSADEFDLAKGLGEEAKSLSTPLFMGVHYKNRVMDPTYAEFLGRNAFKLYDIINHHFASIDEDAPPAMKISEFYNQAYFIKNMFTSQNLSSEVQADIATRVEAIADAFEESHMVDRWAVHTNASSIAGFTWGDTHNQPILGQLKGRLLGGTEKLKKQILQHTLGAHIALHRTSRAGDFTQSDRTLRQLFDSKWSMGLVPEMTIESYFKQELNSSTEVFKNVLKSLFPIDTNEARKIPYFEVHLNVDYREIPSRIYSKVADPIRVRTRRRDWLQESLGTAFKGGYLRLNDIEREAIYTMGLDNFSKVIASLPNAPERFGNLSKYWDGGSDMTKSGRRHFALSQQYVRLFLRQYIEDKSWIDANYPLVDVGENNIKKKLGLESDNVKFQRIHLGTLDGFGVHLPLDRYLQIERFSRFMMAHFADLPTFAGRELYRREVDHFSDAFSVSNIFKRFTAVIVNSNAKNYRELPQLVQDFWDDLLGEIPPTIDIQLPKTLETLFDGCDCKFVYARVLGDKDGQAGFYGGIRKFFHDFTGGYSASGDIVRPSENRIRIYNKDEPSPQGGLGEPYLKKDNIRSSLQQTVKLQIDSFEGIQQTKLSMAELNRLSKAGEITWYDGFTITDLGRQPFNAAGLDEEE